MPRKEVARIFGISLCVPSIKRWLKRRRQSGGVQPTPINRASSPERSSLLEQWLLGQLEKESDLTLKEHCEAFERASAVKVSTATMSRRIARIPGGWPLKKDSSSR
jgi:transposase